MTQLTDICPKCNHEFGEHDGKKCPKPVSEDRLAHVYSLIAGMGAAGAKATAISLVHRGALRELERTGRIVYRNERWFPSEDPERAAHWHCGASFIGSDGREYKCEARNEHHGAHYAWSVVDRQIVSASADELDEKLCAICRFNPPLYGETHCGTARCRREAKHHAGSSANEERTKTMEAIDQIRLDRIAPDPAQPRKHFDPDKLDELAASITKHGVQQPICVRPTAGKSGHYTLIFGERRWRASEIAGLDTIPAIVDTDASDDPAAILERQLVENAQREDIHPLEEGEALSALHHKHGYSIEELQSKVGKSRSHVYARIGLTKLATGVKKALLDGRLPHAHGELTARIPDHKLQEQFCKEVLGEVADKTLYEIEDLGVRHEAVNPDTDRTAIRGDGKRQILSFRAAAALLRRRFQTRFSLATFNPADATLTPAGACGPCPHNSGNQPELPGVAAPVKGESYCGSLSCFEKKTAAQFKRVADAARAQGKKVFDGKKAEAMFYGNGELKSDSGFAAPDQKLPYDVVHTYDNKLTYKKLLGKHIAEVPTAIVQDERGAAVEVLDQKKALEVLREHKLLPKKGASGSGIRHGSQSDAEKKAAAQRKKEREAEKLREEAFPFLLTQAVAAAKDLPPAKAAALWRMAALFLREQLDYAAGELYRSLYDDQEPHDHIGERLEKLKSEQDLRGLVVELLLIQAGDDVTSGAGVTDEPMELATKLLGLDWKKAEKYALDKIAYDKQTAAAEKKVDAKKKGGRK